MLIRDVVATIDHW